MDTQFHHLSELFQQLGLPADPAAIDQFIQERGPLPAGVPMADATLWSTSQAQFLREQIADDADWAEVVDALNALLSEWHRVSTALHDLRQKRRRYTLTDRSVD